MAPPDSGFLAQLALLSTGGASSERAIIGARLSTIAFGGDGWGSAQDSHTLGVCGGSAAFAPDS